MFDRFRKGRSGGDTMTTDLPELRDVLGNYQLPTFPKAAMAVLRELRDPETGLDAIAEHIALDPGLHLRVLRTINAAAFGLSRKVDDLQHALALLGRAKLESLVVAAAVKKALPPKPAAGFDPDTFWLASARRASLARRACSMLAPKEAAEALTAGLLQDMAVPILALRHRAEYTQLYQTWRLDGSAELIELERDTFGYDHAQVGALIAREWELSDRMAGLILSHHDMSGTEGLERSVSLTSRLRDIPEDRVSDGLIARTQEFLSIPLDRAEGVVSTAFEDAREFLQAIR
jgi:HD-like signal output (HDOD) protein